MTTAAGTLSGGKSLVELTSRSFFLVAFAWPTTRSCIYDMHLRATHRTLIRLNGRSFINVVPIDFWDCADSTLESTARLASMSVCAVSQLKKNVKDREH